MITTELKRKCEDKVLETYMLAQRVFGRTFDICKLEFTVGGKRVGGYAQPTNNLINLNPHFFQFKNNIDHIINVTIPHEIAHLLDNIMYPSKTKRHHGPTWKYIMVKLGLKPDRCHDMEGTKEYKPSGPRPRPYVYECPSCKRVFHLTSNLHTKILRGQWRKCSVCKVEVHWKYTSHPIK